MLKFGTCKIDGREYGAICVSTTLAFEGTAFVFLY